MQRHIQNNYHYSYQSRLSNLLVQFRLQFLPESSPKDKQCYDYLKELREYGVNVDHITQYSILFACAIRYVITIKQHNFANALSQELGVDFTQQLADQLAALYTYSTRMDFFHQAILKHTDLKLSYPSVANLLWDRKMLKGVQLARYHLPIMVEMPRKVDELIKLVGVENIKISPQFDQAAIANIQHKPTQKALIKLCENVVFNPANLKTKALLEKYLEKADKTTVKKYRTVLIDKGSDPNDIILSLVSGDCPLMFEGQSVQNMVLDKIKHEQVKQLLFVQGEPDVTFTLSDNVLTSFTFYMSECQICQDIKPCQMFQCRAAGKCRQQFCAECLDIYSKRDGQKCLMCKTLQDVSQFVGFSCMQSHQEIDVCLNSF